MTKRQQRIRDEVIQRRDEILTDARHEMRRYGDRFGFTVSVRFYAAWDRAPITILVMRGINGYVWRELQVLRKGYSEPSWKPLV